MQKYNIAFIPSINLGQFIQYAEELSLNASPDRYMLGINSIPHVSLCHIEVDSNRISNVWDKVNALKLPELHLLFEKKRSKSYVGDLRWGGIHWVSLIPDQIEQLTAIHLDIAKIIKTPLNKAFAEYDPHLTLFNSHDSEPCVLLNHVPQVNPPLKAPFNVVLGSLDDIGQLTNILFGHRKAYLTSKR